MKQISIKLNDEYYEKLQKLRLKWNNEEINKGGYLKGYSITDMIHIIIGMVYDMETDPDIQAYINKSNKLDS